MSTKERPIIFSAPMVSALLDGSKTQTRRVFKLPKGHEWAPELGSQDKGQITADRWPGNWHVSEFRCPYGQPGDRLWVRETWQGPLMSGDEFEQHGNDDPGSLPTRFHSPSYCEYAADGGPPPEFMTADDDLVRRWRPSIHMPRWASRITLEITGVRVERLQDISKADSIAEGAAGHPDGPWHAYRSLWSLINGPGSWDANPWVWVVEFKRIEAA